MVPPSTIPSIVADLTLDKAMLQDVLRGRS
jgi:hypothetical protein